MFVSLIT
jgi:hypothetical protein